MRPSNAVCSAFGLLLVAVEIHAADSPPVLYRLTSNSSYQRGCLSGPCDCAVQSPVPIIGTFVLELQQAGPLYTDYRLTNIIWYADLPEGRARLTGNGTYRIGGEVAVVQRLQLTLTYPDGTVRQFDSEMVIGGGQFPRIDIQTYVTGVLCIDAAIHVAAEPAPYTVYRLGEKSTWTQGCFGGLCACPVVGPVPASGTFLLTLLDENPLFTTYAITDVRWIAAMGVPPLQIRGDGLYRIGGQFAITHELDLNLVFDDSTSTEHLDSGRLVISSGFPAIDTAASTHTLCFNRQIDLQARPIGDFDLNASVDLADIDRFLACRSGPAIEQPDWFCQAADIDGDGDVDQTDFGLFQRCMTGPRVQMDPRCAE